MEKFKVKEFNDSMIVFEHIEDLETMYGLTKDSGQNFILTYIDKEGRAKSELILASDIASKINNGDIKLFAIENNTQTTGGNL